MSSQIHNKYILEFAESAKTSHQNHLESLINHATQHTSVFQFTELLQVQSINDLVNGPLSKSYALLNLFAFSNYSEWFAHQDNYPPLNALQVKKLRILSLVDLAQSDKQLGFELMKNKLGLTKQDELEDLIIESIYAGVIQGKISQTDRILRVGSVISRDVKLENINLIKKKLQKILIENKRVENQLKNKIQQLNNDKEQDLQDKKQIIQNREIFQSLTQQSQQKKSKDSKQANIYYQ